MEHGRTDLPQDVTPRSPAPAMIAHEAAANSAQQEVAKPDVSSQPATPPDATLSLGALPQNLESATALIAQLAASNVELQDSRQQLTQEIEELKLLVTKLMLRLQGHRSERVTDDPNQLKLDFQDGGEAQDALADASADAEQLVLEYLVRRKQAKPKPQRNEKLPEHLPRYDVELPVPDEVQNCPTHGPRVRIGEDVTETLEFERPKLKVRRTIIPKFACPKESECGVQSPDRPAGLVEGNRYDTSVAAEIITGKYGYHLPIYREQDYFAGSGWMASRSTLLNIMTAAAELLEPFYRYLCDEVRTDSVLGTDDTSVTLILPPEVPPVHADDPRSQRVHEVISKARDEGRTTVAAKMWAYRGVELPINVFDFSVSRHRDGPDDFLRDYSGTLMADCYTGYQTIELRTAARIRHAACWSHARRKVYDARDSQPLEASVLLAMIGELYDIEDRAKQMSAAERLALRQLESRPVMSRIRAWLDGPAVVRVLPKNLLGEALGYLRNNWDRLQVYLSDGRIPIDNNDVEQLMKQIALGRKNWLFIGSLAAGRRAAILITLVSSAHRNDLDVWAYIKDVLDRLLAGSTDYHSMRPDVWKLTHAESVRTYRADERRDRADAKQLRRAQRRQRERKKPTAR